MQTIFKNVQYVSNTIFRKIVYLHIIVFKFFISNCRDSIFKLITLHDDSWPATVPSVVPTGHCSHWSIHYIH